MAPRLASFALPKNAPDAQSLLAQMAIAPLHELCPAKPGATTAAIGLALALASVWGGPGLIWAGEEGVFAEDGAPYPPGLAQFGLDHEKLIVIRAAKRDEALWAAEQGLAARAATVICALGVNSKPLDLKATRRLLLFAEQNGSRCLLVRPLAEASAAWTRWKVAHAPSIAAPDEIGRPSFFLELMRSRFGLAGARFILEWDAHAKRLEERVARDLSAAPEYRSADTLRASA